MLCLQAITNNADIEEFVTASSERYPYHATFADLEDSGPFQPACTVDEVTAIATCIATECGRLPDEEVLNCILNKCADVLHAASQACISCFSFDARVS